MLRGAILLTAIVCIALVSVVRGAAGQRIEEPAEPSPLVRYERPPVGTLERGAIPTRSELVIVLGGLGVALAALALGRSALRSRSPRGAHGLGARDARGAEPGSAR